MAKLEETLSQVPEEKARLLDKLTQASQEVSRLEGEISQASQELANLRLRTLPNISLSNFDESKALIEKLGINGIMLRKQSETKKVYFEDVIKNPDNIICLIRQPGSISLTIDCSLFKESDIFNFLSQNESIIEELSLINVSPEIITRLSDFEGSELIDKIYTLKLSPPPIEQSNYVTKIMLDSLEGISKRYKGIACFELSDYVDSSRLFESSSLFSEKLVIVGLNTSVKFENFKSITTNAGTLCEQYMEVVKSEKMWSDDKHFDMFKSHPMRNYDVRVKWIRGTLGRADLKKIASALPRNMVTLDLTTFTLKKLNPVIFKEFASAFHRPLSRLILGKEFMNSLKITTSQLSSKIDDAPLSARGTTPTPRSTGSKKSSPIVPPLNLRTASLSSTPRGSNSTRLTPPPEADEIGATGTARDQIMVKGAIDPFDHTKRPTILYIMNLPDQKVLSVSLQGFHKEIRKISDFVDDLDLRSIFADCEHDFLRYLGGNIEYSLSTRDFKRPFKLTISDNILTEWPPKVPSDE